MNRKYWIAVVSRDHVLRGKEGGFMQVCHGACSPLKRMRPDDYVLFYSPKLSFGGKEPCQAFTALAKVLDDRVYQFFMSESFIPFRRDVVFLPVQETSILPLLPELGFIQDKKRWGYPFRFGLLEIAESDFLIISKSMQHEESNRAGI